MLTRIKHLQLKGKLYLFTIPFTMLLCMTLSLSFYHTLENSLNDELRKNIQAAGAQADSKVQNHLRIAQTDVDFLANSSMPLNMLKKTSQREKIKAQKSWFSVFNEIQIAKPEYRELYLLDKRGNVLASRAEDVFYAPKEDLDWLQKLYHSSQGVDFLLTKFIIVNANQGRRVAVLSPVRNNKGEDEGYVVLTQDLRAFAAMSYNFSPNGDAEVVFKDKNNILLHEIGTKEKELLGLASESESSVLFYKEKYWYTYTLPSNFGEVSVFSDYTSHIEELEELKYRTFGIAVFATISLTWILGLAVNRLFLDPIKVIENDAYNISKGTYSKRTAKGVRYDEIGNLSQSIEKMAKDISQQHEKITELAYNDDLTPLKNKQAFLERIRESNTGTSDEVAILVIDIRSFKQINDINGYEFGNSVILAVANRLSALVEEFMSRYDIDSDKYIVARSGADEFLVTVKHSKNKKLTEALVNNISHNICTPMTIKGHPMAIDTFIGWHHGNDDGLIVYKYADMAMHDAKRQRVSQKPFDPEMLERVKANQKMSDNIKKALELDEFELHYQPKCTPADGREIKEFEALIRWQNKGGFVSPSVFIPFAEEANLIDLIDMWVCERTIKDVARCERMTDEHFVFSFNVSGKRLCDNNFLVCLKEWINLYEITPSKLQVEITEHSLIHDTEKSKAAMKAIMDMGVSVALDDFGTGHSSLGYLKDLPVNTLKIDRCFINGVDQDKNKATLLKHIMAIGHDLGLQIVAEGIETESELSVINQFKCDLIQGYLCFKPEPFDKIMPLAIDMARKNAA
jgi:diguanylate cyclase (GGDEF)-like protein